MFHEVADGVRLSTDIDSVNGLKYCGRALRIVESRAGSQPLQDQRRERGYRKVTMSVVRVREAERSSTAPVALAVADATWYSTHNLFSELHCANVSTLLLRCLDYRNALQRGWLPWTWMRPVTQTRRRLWQRDLVLPSGWMKSFPQLGMRPICHAIESWRQEYLPGAALTLVMTYPHYLYLRDQLRPDRTIYFNIDDYAQYWPGRAARVHELEHQAVLESDLTVCVSRLRCEQLRAALPGARTRIKHLPHGAPTHSIEPTPHAVPAVPPRDLARLPRPYLGYVGTLEDRIDWPLIDRLSAAFPHASIVLIGRTAHGGRRLWHLERQRCLSRPNVHLLGWKAQHVLTTYIRAFDVNLIPYRIDHPFNEVCNPTKLMDSMGTGRPIVATALPECRLYDHLIDVAETPASFVDALGALLVNGSDDGRAALRHAHAVENSCARVVERLLDWMVD